MASHAACAPGCWRFSGWRSGEFERRAFEANYTPTICERRRRGVPDASYDPIRSSQGYLALAPAADPIRECPVMKQNLVNRRSLLRVAMAGAGAAAAGLVLPERAPGKPLDMNYKRRARYQANSAEVRNFYRVNGYPTR